MRPSRLDLHDRVAAWPPPWSPSVTARHPGLIRVVRPLRNPTVNRNRRVG